MFICADTLRYIASFVGDLKWSMTCKQWQHALSLNCIEENGGLDTVNIDGKINRKTLPAILGPRTRHLHGRLSALVQLTDFNLVSLSLNGYYTIINELPPFPPTLQQLKLISFHSIQVIPKFPPTLQQLTLNYFSSVQVIPDFPPTLQRLTLEYFKFVQVIPDFPPTLQRLTLNYFPSVRVLPDFPLTLQQLKLVAIPHIREIPLLPLGLRRFAHSSFPLVRVIPTLPKL